MGKNFSEEVAYLPSAIAWAATQDIKPLERAFQGFAGRNLLAIGSGGSTTAASFLAKLHEGTYGQISRACTPGEFLSHVVDFQNAAIVLVSAEGKNQDILAAAERVASTELPSISFVLSDSSPLAKVCEKTGSASVISFQMPWKKDGYLATNSLVATLILFARTYGADVESLTSGLDGEWIQQRKSLIQEQSFLTHFLDRRSLAVLYGKSGCIGAIDIESKLSEGAFGPCEITDFRQFAHGRHLQLNDEEQAPCFLVFSAGAEDLLCESTLKHFPTGVPIVRLPLPEDPLKAAIISVIDSILISELIGQGLSVDPGQPFVSTAARAMHHLDVRNLFPPRIRGAAPIYRKLQKLIETDGRASLYQEAGLRFCDRLQNSEIKALVCDFDGTFCCTEQRYSGLDDRLVPVIERLANAGVLIAFASGRGDSLYKDLREKLNPSIWKNILVGYYSGSLIEALNQNEPLNPAPDSNLQALASWLTEAGLVPGGDRYPIKMHGGQLSVRSFKGYSLPRVMSAIRFWLSDHGYNKWRAYCSGHSIDVLTDASGKEAVVSYVAALIGCDPQSEILRLGDSGDFDGNDYELLGSGLGLSVDRVSSLHGACWNFLPVGLRGVLGTGYYLDCLVGDRGQMRFSPQKIGEFRKSLNIGGQIR